MPAVDELVLRICAGEPLDDALRKLGDQRARTGASEEELSHDVESLWQSFSSQVGMSTDCEAVRDLAVSGLRNSIDHAVLLSDLVDPLTGMATHKAVIHEMMRLTRLSFPAFLWLARLQPSENHLTRTAMAMGVASRIVDQLQSDEVAAFVRPKTLCVVVHDRIRGEQLDNELVAFAGTYQFSVSLHRAPRSHDAESLLNWLVRACPEILQ